MENAITYSQTKNKNKTERKKTVSTRREKTFSNGCRSRQSACFRRKTTVCGSNDATTKISRAGWRTNAARHPNELRISSPDPDISASDDDGVYSQAPVRNSVPLHQSQAQTRAAQAERAGRREPSSESGCTVINGGVDDAFDSFRFVPFAINNRLASVIAQWVLQQQQQQQAH